MKISNSITYSTSLRYKRVKRGLDYSPYWEEHATGQAHKSQLLILSRVFSRVHMGFWLSISFILIATRIAAPVRSMRGKYSFDHIHYYHTLPRWRWIPKSHEIRPLSSSFTITRLKGPSPKLVSSIHTTVRSIGSSVRDTLIKRSSPCIPRNGVGSGMQDGDYILSASPIHLLRTLESYTA